MSKMVFSLLVENEAGVLSRVAGLFSRRGYNIDSLTVGITENPIYSRMTVVANGEPEILEQIEKQLAKLVDVIEIKKLLRDESVTRELILIKVASTPSERKDIIAIADVFRANIVDVSDKSIMIELTGNDEKIKAFINLLSDYHIKELVRTGVAGLSRGIKDED